MTLSAMAYSSGPSAQNGDNGIMITATSIPEGANLGYLDWIVEWADPECEPAKYDDYATNYVNVESELGENYAYVTALEPFSYQIKITVVSSINPDAKAVVTVDYGQKLSHMSQQAIIAENADYVGDFAAFWSDNPAIITLPEWGSLGDMWAWYHDGGKLLHATSYEDTYTKKNVNETVTFTVSVDNSFYNALSEAGIAVENKTFTFAANELTVANILNSLGCGKLLPTEGDEVVDYEKLNTFRDVVAEYGTGVAVVITANVTSDYDTQSFLYYLGFSPNDKVIATGMTILPGNIVL